MDYLSATDAHSPEPGQSPERESAPASGPASPWARDFSKLCVPVMRTAEHPRPGSRQFKGRRKGRKTSEERFEMEAIQESPLQLNAIRACAHRNNLSDLRIKCA